MKKLFLVCIISGFLQGQEAPLAPLMPLIPGDPLELNLPLRKELYEEDQSARNVAIFQSYHFPWIPAFLVLIGMSSAPLLLYLWLETMRKLRKEEIPTFKEILRQLKGLEPTSYTPRELSFEVAKLFKMGFENGPAMTYQELIEDLQTSQRFSSEQIAAFQSQFEELEEIQYHPSTPSFEEVNQVLKDAVNVLELTLTTKTP